MSIETPVVEAPVVEAPVTVIAPKTPKVAKEKTKAVAPKKDEKKETKPGLRKPQIRILAVLAKGKPMTRAMIAEKAPVDVASCTSLIGSHDEAVRKANDKRFFPSLLGLGLVKFANGEELGGTAYEISAKGKSLYEKSK